ncbi:hypothetical protein BRX36_20535 [Sphingomonas sp. S-NIH.Pt1_0416]|jgi:hypothetical protein|uniref:hypothetical protein n=1 Tax=Sphingomonas panni TaxID=237612 RepID=UPI00064C420C|nr:hypothetical protein [Sphingomonas panni]OMJ30811.1 hypothetical protein BSZ14_16805 [Sphingomonas sp. Sph1(2015)]RSU58331.1 hypothetical protein BRX36_20535 [Sphingomonas sp. S-NIH.Pt1_0416]
MIPGVTERVPVADRLIARWEVSQLNVVPYAISVMAFLPMLIMTIGIAKAIGARPAVVGRSMLVLWVALFVTEMARGIWTLRHRYASPRWLRAVHAAVGDDLAIHALAELMRQHRYEPDYVLLRSDMTSAVQQERAKRKDAVRRSKGIRMMEEPDPASGLEAEGSDPRIAEEQRAQVRERRAAEKILAAAAPVTGDMSRISR